MQDNRYLATVIYQQSLENVTESSYLVGWNLEQFHCLIASAIPKRMVSDSSKLGEILRNVHCNSSYIASRSRFPQSPAPIVLGNIFVEGNSGEQEQPDIGQRQSSIWVTLKLETHPTKAEKSTSEIVLASSNRAQSRIKLLSIYSVGFKYQSSCYLISYSPQDTDSFQCLKNSSIDDFSAEVSNTRSNLIKVDMDLIAAKINASYDLNKFVLAYFQIENNEHNELRTIWFMRCETMLLSIVCRIGVWFYLIGHYINTRISSFMPLVSKLAQQFKWSNLVAVSSVPKAEKFSARKHTFSDARFAVNELSFFMYGVSYRCTQFRKMMRYCASLALCWNISAHAKQHLWLLLVNSIVEMVLDIVLGILAGFVLYRYSYILVEQSEEYSTYFTKIALLDTIEWFNNSPGGVKLNPMITKKMGLLVQFFIRVATKYYAASKFLVLPACWLIACLGTTGLSVQICVIIDLLRLITWPVNLSHIIFSTIFGFMMRLLYSLWLLFNGQKKNIFRKRVDTCEYDPSSLLFGVMLFSILLFAIPNFAAYHYLFVSLRLSIVVTIFLLWQSLMLVKDFPIVNIACKLFFSALLLEESYLEMVMVKEELTPLQGNGLSPNNNFSSENLDTLIHDLSPRLSSTSRRQLSGSSNNVKKSIHASVFHHSFHKQALHGRMDEDIMFDQSDKSPSNSSIDEDLLDYHSPKGYYQRSENKILHSPSLSASKKMFSFEQHDILASGGDRIASTSQQLGSIRKRGEYVHHTAPASAIPLTEAPLECEAPILGNSLDYFTGGSPKVLFMKRSRHDLADDFPSSNSASVPPIPLMDRWRFANNAGSRISSTYFAIRQKSGRWSTVFQSYLRWWSVCFLERKIIQQLLLMIYQSKPLYLHILKLPLHISRQDAEFLDSVVLQSTKKFFKTFASNSEAKHGIFNNLEQDVLTPAGIQSILNMKTLNFPMEGKAHEIASQYWQLVRVSRQGFHQTLEDIYGPNLGVDNPSLSSSPSKSDHQEEKIDDASEFEPLLSETRLSDSVENLRHLSEKINLQQTLTTRRCLLAITCLMIISSLLSLCGMCVFGYMVIDKLIFTSRATTQAIYYPVLHSAHSSMRIIPSRHLLLAQSIFNSFNSDWNSSSFFSAIFHLLSNAWEGSRQQYSLLDTNTAMQGLRVWYHLFFISITQYWSEFQNWFLFFVHSFNM